MFVFTREDKCDLILLTVEDLTRVARQVSHEDAETFEELSRQATRYQAKLDISSLYLSVLGGKAADAVSKAVAKCFKEKNDVGNESKRDVKKERGSMFKRDEVPLSQLSNLYPYQTAGMMYSSAPGFLPGFPLFWGSGGYYYYQGYRSGRTGALRQGAKSSSACSFCESTGHLVKYCEKIKLSKRK